MGNDAWADALDEVENPSKRDRGLWARCYAEADGDESKAKAAYVRARVAKAGDKSSPATTSIAPQASKPPDAYCPNCAAPCYLQSEKCNVCGAEFDGSGWKPLPERPAGVEPPKKRPENMVPPLKSLSSDPAFLADKSSGSSWWKWVIGIPVIGFILLMAIGTATDSPERQQRFREADAIKLCWQEQSRKSLDPGTSRFVAGACERMESDFRQRWGRAP